ncbi:Hypothetical predicted protein [Lecanosticta acicola]|uniref:Uncharacterized protein n=1 Tax=Lecanosticta acicola TaxID=111012 RepID=A0AAI9EDN5_9PEZI|nr:Hypothetical predicted protein [Lecanosticta acicola]
MPLLNSKVTGNGARSVGKSVSFAPSPQTQHAPAKSAWAQGPPGSGFSGASSTYSRVEVTATATSAQAPTYVPPQKKSGAQSTASSMNRAAATMQSMSLNVPSNGTLKVQDPSVAPLPSIAPSMVTSFKPYAGSRFSTPRADQNDKRRKWIKNAVCVKSPWVRNTFQKGHVISLPFHVPNMNENCDPNDKGLTINQNFDGGIFTKRRMMVVLFKSRYLVSTARNCP